MRIILFLPLSLVYLGGFSALAHRHGRMRGGRARDMDRRHNGNNGMEHHRRRRRHHRKHDGLAGGGDRHKNELLQLRKKFAEVDTSPHQCNFNATYDVTTIFAGSSKCPWISGQPPAMTEFQPHQSSRCLKSMNFILGRLLVGLLVNIGVGLDVAIGSIGEDIAVAYTNKSGSSEQVLSIIKESGYSNDRKAINLAMGIVENLGALGFLNMVKDDSPEGQWPCLGVTVADGLTQFFMTDGASAVKDILTPIGMDGGFTHLTEELIPLCSS